MAIIEFNYFYINNHFYYQVKKTAMAVVGSILMVSYILNKKC